MQEKSREHRALCCAVEDTTTISGSISESFVELPHDLILLIIEFFEFQVTHATKNLDFFGYFISDMHRTIYCVFRCVRISDSIDISWRLNNLIPISCPILSLYIHGKESPQVISLVYPDAIELVPLSYTLKKRLSNLETLIMKSCTYGPSLIKGIVECAPNLKKVTLLNPNCRLSRDDFIQTFSHSNLFSLTLDQKSLDDIMLSKVMQSNNQLKKLNLQGYFIDLHNVVSTKANDVLTFPSSLQSLSVGYRSMRNPKHLPWSFGPDLRSLDVSGISINETFAALAKQNKNLVELRLHMCDLSDVQAFSDMMPAFKNIKRLDISWSKIVDIENARTICNLPKITDLTCCNCRISNSIALILLEKVSLQSINMEENRLDEGIMGSILACKIPNLRVSVSKSDGRHIFVRRIDGLFCNSSV
jgi:hypothetical protein